MSKPNESLNRYLRHLAVHLRSRCEEAGDDPEEMSVTSWEYEGRALFFTAYYLLDEEARRDPAVQELAHAAADRFLDRFEDASFDERALDEEYLTRAAIDTGTRKVPGPTVPADGVVERAAADGFEDEDDWDDEDEPIDEDDADDEDAEEG